MKNLRNLIHALCILLVASGFAVAQQKSLAALPAGEKFTSTDANFTISLPKEPTKSTKVEPSKEANERGATYMWNFTEGMITISYNEFLDGTTFRTDKDYNMLFAGFKSSMLEDKDTKIITEEPYKLGDLFRGMSYQMDYAGLKSRARLVAYGNKYYSITSICYRGVADPEKILQKALDSFTFITPPAAPKN